MANRKQANLVARQHNGFLGSQFTDAMNMTIDERRQKVSSKFPGRNQRSYFFGSLAFKWQPKVWAAHIKQVQVPLPHLLPHNLCVINLVSPSTCSRTKQLLKVFSLVLMKICPKNVINCVYKHIPMVGSESPENGSMKVGVKGENATQGRVYGE